MSGQALEVDDVTEPAGAQVLVCPVCHGFGRLERRGSHGRPQLCRHCAGRKLVITRKGEPQHGPETCDCRFVTD